MCADRAGLYFFRFRLVIIRVDGLDVTSVGRDLHHLLAIETFTPAASVFISGANSSWLDLSGDLVDFVTFQTFLYGLADGPLLFLVTKQMIAVTSVPVELAVTGGAEVMRFGELAWTQRLFGLQEVWTVSASIGMAPFSITRMMSKIFVVVISIVVLAEIEVGFGEETLERIASIVMTVFFDEQDEFVRGRLAREDDAGGGSMDRTGNWVRQLGIFPHGLQGCPFDDAVLWPDVLGRDVVDWKALWKASD